MRETRAERVEIRLLGEFGVWIDGRAIPPSAWELRRPAEIVKILALARGHRLARDQVVETLFGHLDPDAGAAALHKAASQARSVLGASDAVVLQSREVALAPAAEVSTDLEHFEQAARRALDSGKKELCASAAALYGGELLPGDRYADWADARRESVRALHLTLLRRAGAWANVVELEPCDERAQLSLMRLYADSGNRAAALRQFRRLREALGKELGIAPSSEAIELYESLSRGPPTLAPLAKAEALIGREVELARARGCWRKAAAGQGGILLVRGEAGIGKTRFCEQLLADAAADDATTLRGGASEVELGANYGPVAEALDRLLLARPDFAERLTEPALKTMARLASAAPCWPESLSDRLDRQLVLSAVAQLLTLAAKERPVMFFVDDLHAADDSTLELVHYLIRMARFDRMLIVAALRPELRPKLEQLRASLLGRSAASEIELGPLSRSEITALVARVARKTMPSAVSEAIWTRAAGNPFFSEALAAAVGPEGQIEPPPGLFDVLEQGLSSLSAELYAALECAAVLGDSFGSEDFLAFVAHPEATALELLQAARQARLIVPSGHGFRFRHALLREAILQKLPEPRRRELEAQAALVQSRAGGSAASIATHLLRAGRDQEAARWLVQAAYDDYAVAAYASALGYLDLALERREPEPELLALRAELLLATGAPDSPVAFEQAIRATRGERREQLRVKLCEARVAVGDIAGATRSLAEIGDLENLDDRVRKLFLTAELDWFRGNFASAEYAADQGLALARALGPGRTLSEAVLMRSLVAHSRGRWPDLVRAQMLDVDRIRDLSASIHEGHLCMTEAYLYGTGSYAKVAAFARELLGAAERAGTRRAIAFALCLLGESELLTGELAAAQQHLDRSLRLSLELGSTGAASLAVTRLAETALYGGAAEQARALLGEALELARRSPYCRRHLLERVYGVRVRAAEPGGSPSVVEEAEVAIQGPEESCAGCSITLTIPVTIACAQSGDLDRARRYLSSSEAGISLLWRGTTWEGALDEARAAVAAAEGDRARAGDLLVQAARVFVRAGQKLDAERCRQSREALD
jgi:DNA-binding SARP family transcriptional activator